MEGVQHMNIAYLILQGVGMIFIVIAIFVVITLIRLWRRNNSR